MARRAVVWIGIDVGKRTHHACAVDAEGKVVFSRKVGNDQAAIEALLDRASAAAEDVRWAIDLTNSYAALLQVVLTAADQRVVYVPGRVVNRMSGVFRGEAKTDARDAKVIADTARMSGADLTVVTATDETTAELRRLVAHREDLMADWVRGVNRLRDLLGSIFPGLEAAFDYSTRSALVLVTGFQTPQALRDADTAGVIEYLHAHRAWAPGIPTMAATAVAAAHAQTVTLPSETRTAVLVAGLARRLLELDREIKDTDKLITTVFRTHPDAAIIESLPGLGPILGAEFLTATNGGVSSSIGADVGSELGGFASSGRLASYAGLVPVPQDSGRISGNLRRPRRYNRRLRRVFYMAALSSLKVNGPSRAFYQRKRSERMLHTQALLALARRLVDVLWALLRDRRMFTITAPQPATAA
ncbi:IS110 family transposase [Pseudonocardia sp. ICBG1293]|uniref:IS110 family transposase n=1 Tax=Pseudonocardia sp. ICBG1293 TaxID=2844382 RepID=UPI001CCBB4C6|nr:IS110 family transposase [Pseudonocardia sp. ICBG1293]